MPGGEQNQFDGQLNDDYSIEVLVYLKSPKYRFTRLHSNLKIEDRITDIVRMLECLAKS